ncbi:GTP 3',8-cyclase MoaA [Corynebacterium pilosum]|uniref:GTP 3',8-cyclase n=1 Tax=Corynebacterium pilosum TaxID=35756 RepID=A0A376CQ50_9CORY|nr:GTP 3',8-cyclase MoaA [Corynebacterium pilosum]STC70219.1 molybdenum cofactor biosynthesis protein A [Corynebacterium pilosum]
MTDRTITTLPLTVTPKRPVTEYTAPADLPDAQPDGSRPLVDRFGRVAHDLRVSLTDRCNLRCTYCMPADGLEWIPTDFTLNDEETIRLIRIGVEKLGIRMVRFTGGEPLLRKNLDKILAATKEMVTDEGKAPQTALTTNGLSLARQAQKLADAGLDRVNISLDTIDPELYARLTRRDRINDVFKAIDAALEAGLNPVKINAVVMPGVNEDGILDLARFALEKGTQLRFIEQMPLGPREEWKRSDMVTAEEIIDKLKQEYELTPAKEPRGSAPAALWNVTDGELTGSIGIIASVTHPFCGDCDRTRLTTDGAIRNCLFASQGSETSLRDLMRAGASDDELARAWAGTMWEKKPGHGIDDEGFLQPDRPMSAIGG